MGGTLMGSARHTSPELSRRLRDAGLEQRVVPGSDLTRYWLGDQLCDSEAIACGWDRIARALRLDEVLEEIEKRLASTDGLILCKAQPVDEKPWFCEVEDETPGMGFSCAGETDIEAASLVLLSLLRGRR